jgi:hypothetical protein
MAGNGFVTGIPPECQVFLRRPVRMRTIDVSKTDELSDALGVSFGDFPEGLYWHEICIHRLRK